MRNNDRASDRVQEPRPRARWYDEDTTHEDERNGWGVPAPAKLTRTGKPLAQSKLSGKRTRLSEPGAASPEHTLQYSRWLLSEERGWSAPPVQRRATGEQLPDEGALASAFDFLSGSERVEALPAELSCQLRAALGVDASRVRVHTGERAAAAAELLAARAFTLGEDIYFAAGAYDPHSEHGLELIAHEVAHVAQHQRGSAPTGGRVSRASDHHELEADELARRFLLERSRRQARLAGGPAAARDAGVREADEARGWWRASAPRAAVASNASSSSASSPSGSSAASSPIQRKASSSSAKAASAGAPPLPEVVDLLATSSFEPSAAIAAHIARAGKSGAQVRVKLGALGSGIIRVKKAGKSYVTVEDKPQVVPLALSGSSLFVPLPGLSPVVRVRISASRAGSITGYVAPEAAAGNERALQKALGENPEAIGLRGFELPHLQLTNKLENGTLSIASQKGARFSLGGWVDGALTFGLVNSTVTLDANAHIHARGLKDAELAISRDAQGHLHGSAELSLDLGDKFSGSARATYESGDVAIKGELAYRSEKFSGKLGLIVADAAQAEQMVRAQIDPMGVMPLNKVGGDPAKKPARAKKGERAIAGWGELDFAFTDWLTGKAMVVYGPTGHLTVVGKIAPPKRLDLMKQPKGFKRPIMPEVKIEASYGLPYIADIHVGIGVSLSAEAELGPIYMSDLAIEGIYSTDPTVMNAFSITGALRAQAHAGLELDVKGYAGLRILKHSVNVGAGIKGNAGIKAYAEARPTLGYREVASPTAGKQGEYYLKGHLEMAAQPVLALGGRLFIELDSPWWSPAPDKTWEWPIGSLEYPLPTQLGVGADIDYIVGSDKWPELKLTQPSFDASKFVDTMMDDRLPQKSGAAGDQSKKGDWKGVAPTAPTAAPPTVAKTPTKDTKPTAGAASKQSAKGKQLPEEKKNVPQTKDAAERWTAGMEALGDLRKRSEKDPETSTEIRQHLADLKSRFGFTELKADRSGDQWLVDASMNPSKKDIPIKADPKDDEEGEKAGSDGEKKVGTRLALLESSLLAETAKQHPKRSALEARCHALAAQFDAHVRISNHLATGTSDVEFVEKAPLAGQKPASLKAQIVAVGKSDPELHAKAGGASNMREVEVAQRNSPNKDIALVNLGPNSMAKNPAFEADARAFEDKLGALAWRHPAAIGAAATMAAKAKSYIQIKVGGTWDEANAELVRLCDLIGGDSAGWSGAVGKAVKAIAECFDHGNIAERMNHVGGFYVNILGPDLLNEEAKVVMARVKQAKMDVDLLQSRRQEMLDKRDVKKANVSGWDAAPVPSGSAAEAQWHARASRANAMGVPDYDERGNWNSKGKAAVARSERTLAETGVTMSPREEALQQKNDPTWDVNTDAVKWEEGIKVWVMNERDQWVQWQRHLSLPVGAGPSGTTNQLMQSARALGAEPYSARAACIAYLLPSHHHSLVEIVAAAAPFDCSYTPGQRMYRDLLPFQEEELRACGKDGKFPDEAHGGDDGGDAAVRLVLKTDGAH